MFKLTDLQPCDSKISMPYTPDGRKICSRCKTPKDTSEFHKRSKNSDGIDNACKLCIGKYRKKYYQKNRKACDANTTAWRKANKDRIKVIFRRSQAKHRYGLSLEMYDSMTTGPCSICGDMPNGKKRHHLDHCHNTNKARGALCSVCNIGIGMLKHDTHILRKAISYLNKHSI